MSLEKFDKLGLLFQRSLKRVSLKTFYYFVILYWNWHPLYWNVVAYKLCIKWFIFTINHILSLNPIQWYSYVLEHMPTYIFTRTAVRQRVCFCHNHSIKYCFHLPTCCCFHVFPAQPFIYRLWVLCLYVI